MRRQIQTMTEQIYHAMRADIFAQRLHFGEKITTKALQERLGVSSTPIREALARLEKDGLIVVRPNTGMRVVSYTEKDVSDIYTLMTELDAVALRLACAGPKRSHLVDALRTLQEEAALPLMQADAERWGELSDAFHLLFYQWAGNPYLSDAASKTRSQLTVFSYAYQQSAACQEDIQRQHDTILRCLENGDDAAAEEALRRHFASSLKKALDILHAAQA